MGRTAKSVRVKFERFATAIQKFCDALRRTDSPHKSDVTRDERISIVIFIHLGKPAETAYDARISSQSQWRFHLLYKVPASNRNILDICLLLILHSKFLAAKQVLYMYTETTIAIVTNMSRYFEKPLKIRLIVDTRFTKVKFDELLLRCKEKPTIFGAHTLRPGVSSHSLSTTKPCKEPSVAMNQIASSSSSFFELVDMLQLDMPMEETQ